MDFYEVIKKRRSIRSYKSQPIPKESLDKIAEAIQDAPSACNKQPWSFLVAINAEIRKKICSCYNGQWLREAPAIIAVIANMDTCWKRLDASPIANVDIAIAMEHAILAATAEGLGTCWVCAYKVDKMNEVLGIEKPWTVLAISPLGYPAEEPIDIKRKPLSEIFQVQE